MLSKLESLRDKLNKLIKQGHCNENDLLIISQMLDRQIVKYLKSQARDGCSTLKREQKSH